MSMEILDCTLRDGGYINNWRFGRETIAAILEKLDQAGIDIIECGFLTREGGDRDCSLFSSLEAVEAVLPRQRRARYVAMIALGRRSWSPAPCRTTTAGRSRESGSPSTRRRRTRPSAGPRS